MKSKFTPRHQFLASFATLCLSVAPTAHAGTIWDAGGGATTNINTAANWGGVVNALNGTTTATFATAGSTATINTNASFTGITFNRDAAFTIADGSGSLTVGSGGITVTLPTTTGRTYTISESSLVLGANQTWSVTNNTGAARLDVSSVISGAAFGITKTGTGRLTLTGANTFGGGIAVHEGSLYVGTSTSALGGSGTGNVLLGNTSGTANATLGLAQSIIFPNPITVQAGSSGTVSINNDGFFGATLSGTVTLDKSLSIANTDNAAPIANITVSGKITGVGALNLSASNAAGQITLSNTANDYTGATAINSGIVRLTGNLGNTAVTVASGATMAGEGSIGATGSLTFNSGSNLRVDGSTTGALSATGNLTLNATTSVILDAVPAATGTGTTIRLLNYNGTLAGTDADLLLQNAANYRNAVISTATANQVNLTIDTKSLTWSGATSDWDIDTSLNWSSGTETFFAGDAVNFTDAGTTKDVTLGGSVVPASTTFSNSTGNDYSLTGAGAISGASSLTKSNTGTVTLSTANTYTGGTTISGGKIAASVVSALGTGSVTNNATLDLTVEPATGTTATYTGLSTALSGNGVTNVTLGAGSGSSALNGNYSGFTGVWNIGVGAAAGAGKVQMNGLDNASATINVLVNGTVFASGAVTKNAAIVLNGGDTGEAQGQLRLEGGATWAGPVTLAGDITGTSDGNVGSNSGGGTISGDIGQTGGPRALVKVGGSVITLSGDNTYTGATTVSAGTLRIGSTGALGNGTLNTSGITVGGSAILDLAGIATTATVPLTLNSSASGFDVGCFYNSGASVTFGGTVTLNANTRVGAGAIILNNTITGNGRNLNRDGLGTLQLSNSGTVTLGSLLANRGTIQVDSGTTLDVTGITIGTGTNVGAGLTLSGGSVTSLGAAQFGTGSGSASGTLQLNSGTLTVPSITKGAVTFNANFNGGTLKANAASAGFLTATSAKVQAGGALIDDGGNAITIAQPLIHDTALATTPDGGLTKSGLGTLVLSGLNTYTGNTTVNAGILALAQANASNETSTVTVLSGAKIDIAFAGDDTVGTLILGGVSVPAGSYNSSHPTYGGFFLATGTGSIVVPAAGGYASWIDDFGLALADQDPTDDPDSDGMENLLEFVLNGNPSISDPTIQPDLVVTATDFEFTYNRRDDSLSPETTQTFQYGTDLSAWTSIVVPAASGTVGAATITVTDGTPADTVKISIPKSTVAPETKLFGRLQVVK